MEQIKIGGFTIEQLKKMQVAVQKDANKVIAQAIADAEKAVADIIEIAQEYEDIEDFDESRIKALAKLAEESLALAELVSGISGVEYSIAYNEEYCNNDDVLSNKLNEIFDWDYPNCLSVVMDKLEGMEQQSYLWNSSSVHC